jgi:cyclopropane fatty-acyl-phospholipid synthase-like methyltransferase
MAFELADSEFIGIDSAERPIAQGKAMVEALGLKNLSLSHADITEISQKSGHFNYIIAHGVYSWVLPQVRDKLLEICHNNLDPSGVTYVSYNALPGWHFRNMTREMMLFHVGQFSDPAEQVDQGLALIKFLAESSLEPDP